MPPSICIALAFVTLSLAGLADATEQRPFTQTLTPAQMERLGLTALTPAQRSGLDAAIDGYKRQTEAEATQRAEKAAAETAVAEYKKQQEPGVVARALERFKRKGEEERIERFTARIVGQFRGWSGSTSFPLDNGQVWRQASSDTYELPAGQDVEVEIYRAAHGYWRLKLADGAWVTVRRVQ